MNENRNTAADAVTGSPFQLFNLLPVGFWTTYSTLYTHFLDKGVGNDRASQQAMEAITVGLPVIQTQIGLIPGGIGVLNRTAA